MLSVAVTVRTLLRQPSCLGTRLTGTGDEDQSALKAGLLRPAPTCPVEESLTSISTLFQIATQPSKHAPQASLLTCRRCVTVGCSRSPAMRLSFVPSMILPTKPPRSVCNVGSRDPCAKAGISGPTRPALGNSVQSELLLLRRNDTIPMRNHLHHECGWLLPFHVQRGLSRILWLGLGLSLGSPTPASLTLHPCGHCPLLVCLAFPIPCLLTGWWDSRARHALHALDDIHVLLLSVLSHLRLPCGAS